MGKTKKKKHRSHGKKQNEPEREGTKSDEQHEGSSTSTSNCKRQQVDIAAAVRESHSEFSFSQVTDSETSKDQLGSVPQGIDRESISKDQPKTVSPLSDSGTSKDKLGVVPQGTVNSETITADRPKTVSPLSDSGTSKDKLDSVPQNIDREAVSKDQPETVSPLSDSGTSKDKVGVMPQGTDSGTKCTDQPETVFPEDGGETTEDQLSGQTSATEGTSSVQDAECVGSLDQQLEEAAARRNLSVLNVKSILHHVLKDKRVLALVQRRAAEEEGKELQGEWDDVVTYEPKLTRSRVRQAVASGIAEGTVSPEKLASLAKATRQSAPVKSKQSTEEQRACSLLEVTFPEEESSDEEYNPAAESFSEEEEEEGSEGEGEWMEAGHSLSAVEHLQTQKGTTSMGTGYARAATKSNSDDTPSRIISTDLPICVPTLQVSVAAVTSGIKMSSAEAITTAAPIVSTASQQATSVPTSTPLYAPPFFPMSSTSQETILPTFQQSQVFATVPNSQQGPVFPPTQISQQGLMFPTTQTFQQGPMLPTLPMSQQGPVPLDAQTFQRGSMPPAIPSSQQGPVHSTGSNSSNLLSSATDTAMQEAAALLASLSDVILSPPRPILAQSHLSAVPAMIDHGAGSVLEQNLQQNEEEIAKRTRSKHPLTDTSISAIEASFIPPDLEDPPSPMELDDEDLQWQNWLADLMSTSATDVGGEGAGNVVGGEEGEDQDDMEYNYLADQQEEEKEEFRNDRAVRIPQKEVADLLDELLYPSDAGVGGLLSNDGVDLVSAYLLESLGIQAPLLTQGSAPDTSQQATENPSQQNSPSVDRAEQASCYLSTEQTTQLWTQIQQHHQLLMQTFVLSRYEPSLVFLSQIAAQAVDEMTQWCQEAREGRGSPVWYIPELNESNELIRKLDPADHDAVELIAASGNPPRIPEAAQDILMNHRLFWKYPKLLPGVGFAPMTPEVSSGGKYFTTQEEHLLVLGMDHYGPSAWSLIQENLLPTKTVKQLQLRVKNQCSKRKADNIIKDVVLYGKICPTVSPQSSITRKQRKSRFHSKAYDKDEPNLPQWILHYHKKRVDKDKEEEKKRERELQESRKMVKLLDGVLKSSKTATLKPKSSCLPGIMPAGSESDASTHSKRNLTSEMIQVETEAKKLRLEEPTGNKLPASNQKSRTSTRPSRNKGGKRVRQDNRRIRGSSNSSSPVSKSPQRPLKQSPVKILQVHNPGRIKKTSGSPTKTAANSEANMEYLLLAAGLEISDPAARYAYNYLTEVKVTLADSEDIAYEDFLKVLMSAKKENWNPSKIYSKVQLILRPWPHLLKLFTEFLEPQDCIEANVLGDKYELESVKSFVGKLQSKFASAPLKLEEIMKRLTQLDTSDVTKEKVQSSVLPLIKAHEELVEELRRFLFQLAPPARPDDVYEEIILGSDCEKEPDEFEEVILPDSPLPNQKEAESHSKAPCDLVHEKAIPRAALSRTANSGTTVFQGAGIQRPSHKLISQPDKQEISSQELCREPMNKAQVVTVPPENYKAPNKVDPTADRVKDDEMDTSTDALKTVGSVQDKKERTITTAVQRSEWTKDEDRLILQSCAKTGLSTEVMNKVTSELNRTQDEVKTRYKQLFTLFHSAFSQQTNS